MNSKKAKKYNVPYCIKHLAARGENELRILKLLSLSITV